MTCFLITSLDEEISTTLGASRASVETFTLSDALATAIGAGDTGLGDTTGADLGGEATGADLTGFG